MWRVVRAVQDGGMEEGATLDRLRAILQAPREGVWLDLEGEPPEAVEEVGRRFHLHPVTIEDLLHRNQRPKIEAFDDYLFVVIHGVTPSSEEDTEEVSTQEVHVVLGKTWILSVHPGPLAGITRLCDQVTASSLAVDGSPSFLLYHISDLLVDSYFPALDALEERIDELEDEVVERPTQDRLQRIFGLKRALVQLRKVVSPQREVYNALSRRDYPWIDPRSAAYFRDLHDHLIRATEIVESYRDLVSNMLDAYLATISNRLNDVMRRLTVIATIFMPLSFVTGVFGMNFTAIPYGWTWLFWAAVAVMVATPLAMVVWFVRRGWIGEWRGSEARPWHVMGRSPRR